MSLAQYASPYNNDDSGGADNINANIRMTQSHDQGQNKGGNNGGGVKKIPSTSMRKTIKRPPIQQENRESPSRVASFMNKLNSSKMNSTTTNYTQGEDVSAGMDESESDLADYHPSSNSNNHQGEGEGNQNGKSEQVQNQSIGHDDAVTRENFENLPSTYARQYYQQYAPYNQASSSASESMADVPKDEIIQKMNHIIQMLEDQQDEKTGSVTEELILYCFLGVFVIFVVDSFVRAGKYVR
jgi:hypothetical protein